ncbi:MAG: hypothetical protein KIT72_19160 [Polyangiaceae bacterium]|nr:hypothetical protein [Polyangiaceae bacterium]MCW5792539.1 hypothetical protein [Polyangiaceae bacterium]
MSRLALVFALLWVGCGGAPRGGVVAYVAAPVASESEGVAPERAAEARCVVSEATLDEAVYLRLSGDRERLVQLSGVAARVELGARPPRVELTAGGVVLYQRFPTEEIQLRVRQPTTLGIYTLTAEAVVEWLSGAGEQVMVRYQPSAVLGAASVSAPLRCALLTLARGDFVLQALRGGEPRELRGGVVVTQRRDDSSGTRLNLQQPLPVIELERVGDRAKVFINGGHEHVVGWVSAALLEELRGASAPQVAPHVMGLGMRGSSGVRYTYCREDIPLSLGHGGRIEEVGLIRAGTGFEVQDASEEDPIEYLPVEFWHHSFYPLSDARFLVRRAALEGC